MNKWKALAIVGIWIGIGMIGIGAGMAGTVSFINFPMAVPIAASVATWLIVGQKNS